MIIKADLHTHTDRSNDGRQSLSALVAAAKAKGLQAVAVTDHFLFSPLPEEMDGVLLIPGCELSTAAGHMTGLFLERKPCTDPLRPVPDAVQEIRDCGGIAIMAHPFQKAGFPEADFTFDIDGLETANARACQTDKDANNKACALAEREGYTTIGGSDAHCIQEVGNAYTEIQCKALTRSALKEAILRGDCKAVLVRNTPHRLVGLSQLARRKRFGGLRNYCAGLLRLCKYILLDIKNAL